MNEDIPFIGRRSELRSLDECLERKVASLIVIRGRRRIGKSRLAYEFMQDKKGYIFTGLAPTDKTTAQSERDEFVKQLAAQTNLPEGRYDDWNKIFLLLAKETKKNRIVILFDEISWIGSKDPDFLGKLKNAWDLHFKKNSKLILILCGSVSWWIEKNIVSSTGFFGRIPLKLSMEEMPLKDCNALLKAAGFKRSSLEKLMILAVTGGVPWYLELVNPNYSAQENIRKLCFEKNGTLVDEFRHIFHDLFGRRRVIMRKIVEFLAKGPAEYNEIVQGLSYSRSGSMSEYLEELVISGFVSRDYNWSFKSGQDTTASHFRLKDNYLRFYLKYIAPRLSKIKHDQFSEISLSSFPNWDGIMGLQFENLILNNRRLIRRILGVNPEEIISDNPYFQHSTSKNKGCQIDYLIQTRYNNLFACEIRFCKNKIDISVLAEMKDKIASLAVPKGFAVLPVLIHVNGVSEEVVASDYFFKIIDVNSLLET